MSAQYTFAFGPELIVDLFAGGGGASLGIEQAFGRDVDVAINHDATAVSVHERNHPRTRHYCEDVFQVDPIRATGGKPVGLMHASPDCTHHSQARGGQPRSRKIRALSWVVLKWAGRVRPRVITLENVEQILHWSPLVAKRDRATGRVLRVDGSVAAPGERVPLAEQFLEPCRGRRGKTWGQFVAALRGMGYAVQWRKLKACDFGAPTSRERLFMVARCDGLPIRWPKPTHGKGRGLVPYRTAAECVDWSVPCPSIFTRRKPLAEATLRRVAKGIKRFVIDAAEPFIVPIANWSRDAVHSAEEPMRTQTASPKGGAFAVVAPYLVPRYGERAGQEPRTLPADAPAPTVVPDGNGGSLAVASIVPVNHAGDSRVHGATEPLRTITGGCRGEHAAMVAFLEQANTGMVGHDARGPLSTIVGKGSTQRLIAAHVQHASTSNTNGGRGKVDAPLRTILAGGTHNALVECTLSAEAEAGAMRVAAFLMRYHGTGGQWSELRDPATAVTTKDRLALVTVTIAGEPYVIVDIGLRMLAPDELKRAQGFPPEYVLHEGRDGKPTTKTAQVRLIGNSVSPPPLRALVEANVGELLEVERRERVA